MQQMKILIISFQKQNDNSFHRELHTTIE